MSPHLHSHEYLGFSELFYLLLREKCAVMFVSNTLLVQQPPQMVEWRIRWRFASHLCPLHQGTEILRIVVTCGHAGILRNEAFVSRSGQTVWGCLVLVWKCLNVLLTGRGVTHTPHPLLVPRSKNRVELYLYCPLGLSRPIKRAKSTTFCLPV